jgi:SRSO17 transposase
MDEYCQWYQPLFPAVRSLEAFKQLYLALIREAKRKLLPMIATVAGLDNAQSLCHFLIESRWLLEDFRQQRLQLIRAC